MLNDDILDFCGINILTTGDYHILFAVNYMQIPIDVKASQVSSAKPTIFKKLLAFVRRIQIA